MSGVEVGQSAKDLKAGKALTIYKAWYASVKFYKKHIPVSYGGKDKQRAALVRDVLEFIHAR